MQGLYTPPKKWCNFLDSQFYIYISDIYDYLFWLNILVVVIFLLGNILGLSFPPFKVYKQFFEASPQKRITLQPGKNNHNVHGPSWTVHTVSPPCTSLRWNNSPSAALRVTLQTWLDVTHLEALAVEENKSPSAHITSSMTRLKRIRTEGEKKKTEWSATVLANRQGDGHIVASRKAIELTH